MLHDPRRDYTPSQLRTAIRQKARAARIKAAARREPITMQNFNPPKIVEVTLPPIPNALMAYAADIEFKPAFSQVETIQRAVLAFYPKVSLVDLKSARRTAAVVRPRQIAMFLVKALTTRSLPDIGRRFGGRDHTTVLHAVRKIERLSETDPALSARLEEIKALIVGEPE